MNIINCFDCTASDVDVVAGGEGVLLVSQLGGEVVLCDISGGSVRAIVRKVGCLRRDCDCRE